MENDNKDLNESIFDKLNKDNKNESIFDKLPAKTSFWLGVLSSLAIVFAIGFFIMLILFFNRGFKGRISDDNLRKEPPVAAAPTPQPPTNGGNIDIKPVDQKKDWIRGNKNAKISVIEFSDTECPFCKRFHPTMKQLLTEYKGKVNWVYRHFPLRSLHSKAAKEAEALECAGELGGNEKFWAYLDKIFEITPSNDGLDPAQLPIIAQKVGLDKTRFQKCLDSGKYASKVSDHERQAVAAGGRGTPYSVILKGNTKIPVSGAIPYSQLKSIIDSILE